MRYLVAGLLLFLMAVSSAWADDCTLKQYVSLDMGNFANRIVVPVTIAGKQFHFLMDTGGVYSFIDKAAADALGLEARPLDKRFFEYYDVKGQVDVQYVDVQNFSVGPILLHHFYMLLANKSGNGANDEAISPNGIDGVLAPDFLSQVDIDFDFANRKVNFFSQDHCPGKVVYWSPGSFAEVDFKYSFNHIMLSMNLDGHDLETVLDTGSPRTFLDEDMSRRVMNVDEKTPGVELAPADDHEKLIPFSYRFKSLSAGGLGISNPLIFILADRVKEEFHKTHDGKQDYDPIYGTSITVPDLILGYDVLSKLHLFLSYKERKLYFTSAGAHP